MKKLYRLYDDRKIAGICGGIAHQYGWDATIVRLVAVFLCVATAVWPGLITYCIGWYLIPQTDRNSLDKENQ